MIKISKKRIINLFTIAVLLLSYSGLWAQQTCASMPEPVAYTQVSATSSRVEEYAYTSGMKVTRILQVRGHAGDKIRYSNEETLMSNDYDAKDTRSDETYCGRKRTVAFGNKKYPFMDSNKVSKITYKFSRQVVDAEVFLAAFGYNGLRKNWQNSKPHKDVVKITTNKGNVNLTLRSSCETNADPTIVGNEISSKDTKTTDAKIGVSSSEPFTELYLEVLEPAGQTGGYGFFVEICMNSVEPINKSACNGPVSIGSNFPATAQATKVLNGVEVTRKATGVTFYPSFPSDHCGSSITYPANLPLLEGSKELSYEFKKPIYSAEIFLYAFGDKNNEGTYDEVEFLVDGGGQLSLVKTYECNPKVANITGSILKSVTKKTVTDVAVKVTSTKPFTKITLKDKASTGLGYSVALCPASIYALTASNNCTPATIGSNFQKQVVATATMNGVIVKRTATGIAFSGVTSSDHCGGTVNYPAGLPLLINNKQITYDFSIPVRSAEIFLYYFGDNLHENTRDKVKFAVNGGGTAALTNVYDCNPGLTTISGMEVSSTTKKITTDVGIRVTSTQPFTKITLTDVNSDGGGYYVVICPNSVKRPPYNSGALCSAMPDPNFIGVNTATLNGIQVTVDRHSSAEITSDYTAQSVACQPTYKRGATRIKDSSKVVTYKFDQPVNNVEVWFGLMAGKGKNPSYADVAKITTNCATDPTLSIVADCVAAAAIAGNKVWADGEKGVDVGVKVTSDKPFTELTITDDNSQADGYFVELCPASIKKQGIGGTDILSITTQLPTTSSLCLGQRSTLAAKATLASNFTGTINYQWQRSTDGGILWTDVSGATGTVASGANASYTFTPTMADNTHQYRVKYTYTNTALLCDAYTVYTNATTLTVKQIAAITSLTASPTSLNETGATNIVYTIKGTPGATVTYNINGGTAETLVLDPATGVKTVNRNGETAKTTLTITKVEKTGLCPSENLGYKAEVDALGSGCTTHPSIQFAQASPATATMNGIQVTRTIAGVQDFFQSYTYTSGQMCQQTIMQGYPVMNANKTSIKYAFDKPITSVEVWLSGFGGETAPARADRVTFTLNCSGTEVFAASGCGSVTNTQFIATGNEVTHQANVYTQARVKVSSSVPFTELTLNDPGSTAGGYTVELCPGSIKPAVIKVTENPSELTACIGATGKSFTAKAKIEGLGANENMNYKWQQSRTPNTPGSWVDAVAPFPNGSIKADGSTQARLTLNTIQTSDNGLYYRAEFTYTKCNKTLEKVYSGYAKLNVPSNSDIITITAPVQGNITTSDCTASTQVSVQAKIADAYTIKNDGGGNLFGYFLQYKDTHGTWKDHATQKFSNNANNADKKLTINHGQTASGTVFRVRYTVTLTTGCEYTLYSSEFTFTKNLPAAPAITTPQTFCQSENKTLAGLTTLSNIKWYNAQNGGTEVLPSTTIPVGTNDYWATVTTNGCESTRKKVTVKVVAKPNAPTVQTKTECPATGNYDMKNLVTSIPTGHTLKWYAAATGNATTASTIDRNKTAKTTYEKWVALVTPEGCESDRVKVTYIVDITTQPTITAPAANLAVNCADTAAVTDAAVNAWAATATATVGCGTPTVTNNYTTVKPADLCSVGEIEVTFTVTDAFGTQKAVNKKITVNRLIANNDTATVARSTGGDINVLSNDSVNGAPATTANAVVNIVNANGTGATVTSDGKIHIPGGTLAPATYNITYKICDKNNPSLCGAPATIALTVNNSTIQANNDDPQTLTYATSVAYAKNADNSAFNVLANDRLSGVAPNTTQVDIILGTTATGVSIESDGRIKVAASTPAGVYTLTYKIKEKNTTNQSAEATVTVKVKNTLTATPATLDTPITPSVDASTPKEIGDVLDQTRLNGNKPNTSQVGITVTQHATPPVAGDPVPSINTTTGKVEIPSGVKPGTYTIKYKLCDKVTPQTCTGEVTLPITVAGGNTTTTVADDFTANPVERSNAEEVVKKNGTPVNVLSNDKLGTRTNIDTHVVTIRQTATSNSGVNIDTATGQIKVAANTPAGVYEVKYKVKEKGQTTESAEATAKIVVKNKVELDPATIPATVNTPDNGTPKEIANILDKAKINGNKPNVADVVITVPNPAHKDAPSDIVPYVDTTTGKVIVPVGTKPGNHQITYQVCDKMPTGQEAAKTCKTATITIPVAANTATSANDDYSSNPVEFSSTATSYVKNGTDDANVLSNDALGSNTTITTNLVDITQTHTSHSGVNIETTTGKVKVAPNTPAGEYTVKYTIAEKGGGTASTESTVKVVVKNKVELTPASVPSSVTPATGGTPKVIADVLTGTKINGSQPGTSDVTISVVTPATPPVTGDPVPSVNTSTGKVEIPAGVKPGNYSITYKVCDKVTPASANTCQTATITIKVAGNHLDPKDDDFSEKKVERTTSNTYVKDGANDLNVLTNDKLGAREGLDTNVVTIDQTYTSNTGVTIETATGKVKVAANTPAGEYTVKYKITEKGQTTASEEVTVKVTVTNKLEVETVTIPATVKPSTDSTTPVSVGNILAQTKINGHPNPDPSQVTITATPSAPGSPKVPYIDTTTGKVMIPAGVAPGNHTITYKVCDKSPGKAKRCEEASVTVNVVSNTATSADDDFSAYKVEHPTSETVVSDGTNHLNILSNDKLGDDDSITTNEVEITQTHTSNPKVKIDTRNGEVNVEGGTPAGVYTLKYKIKEKGQPATAASQEKTVTVVVTNKLVSNSGNYGGAPSTTPTPADGGNVLDNVRINDSTSNPSASEVTITIDNNAGAGTVPYLETSGADKGKIKIPQGTPAGNYTIVYTVCDNAPAAAQSCQQATATVTVSNNPIIARNDNNNKAVEFSTAVQNVKKADGSTLNILGNDTLAGVAATASTVTIETTVPETGITIKTNGEVEVAANKAAGVYNLKYKIRETADLNNVSGEATVKVVIKNKVTFDTFPTTPVNPSTDKDTPATPIDVIAKTKINGSVPPANQVTIEVITGAEDPLDPGKKVPVLNTTTGKVEVPAGVAPGDYTIKYKVCDKVQLAEAKTCVENTITIKVAGNTITAVADNFTAHKVERSTSDTFVNDGTNDVNVLTNDVLGSRTNLDTDVVTITQTHTSEPKVTIDTATGKVKVAANAPAGTHTVKYTITEKGQTTASAEVEVKVVVVNKIEITPDDVISNPVTPSTDSGTPKEIGDVLNGTKLNGTKPGIGTGQDQVTITVVTPATPQVTGDPVPSIDRNTGKVKIPAGVKPGNYSITYKVCDNATPQTCETSTVTITVEGNTTSSADDDFSAHKVENPTTDTYVTDNGTPVNVLSNDKLGDDDSITTDEVEITQTATSDSRVNIETSTGKVKVAANTPAGVYTVKYTFKEKGQPDTEASDERTATVVVTNKVEPDSINDYTGKPSTNSTPTDAGSVLNKIKINGANPTGSQVTITVDTPAGTGTVPYIETTGPDAGQVKIPQGTPAGDYAIVYTICDKAPGAAKTCKQVTATVHVDANHIEAVYDNNNKVLEFSTAAQNVKKADGTPLNVLDNDKLDTTTGLSTSLVTIQTTHPVADITIKSNGEVEVAANKPAGVYELKYKIKDNANPTANISGEAIVKVVVKNKVEIDPISTTPRKPSTYSTTPAEGISILDKVKLNGSTPTADDVTIEVISVTPSNDPKPTINPATGKVEIPSGVQPGTYTIEYKVCDKAQPDEAKTCVTETVSVLITGNTIDAVADDFTAHKVERPATATFVNDGTNDVNVLSNDKLGARIGLDTEVVTITQTDSTDPKVSIDTTTGKVKVDADAPAGEHVLKYKITEKGQTTASNEVEVKVVVTNKVVSNDATYTGKPATDATPRPIGNVLDNVRINGATTNPAPNDVTVSVVTPATGTTVPSLITTGTDAGKIVVPQGTPAGDYTIVYKVCDNATGAAQTCKTNTATVKVAANIVLNPDEGKTVPKTGGTVDVLDNDTINGNPATKDNVDISIVDDGRTGATVDPATGKINVPGGLAPGEYTIRYKVCEKGQTDNCETGTVKVVVPANIVLNPDEGKTVPKTGGTVDVLDNDTVNGNPATKDNVDISIVDNGGTGATIDSNGKIVIPDGATPGEHTIRYKVCEKGTNRCEEGTVKVVVAQENIVANADNYEQQWSATETVVKDARNREVNVLTNDQLASNRSLSTILVDIEQVEASSDKVSIDTATGKVKIAAGTPVGTYTLKYTIKPKGQATPVSTPAIVTVVVKNKVEVTDDEISGTPSDSDTPNEIGNVTDNIKLNGQKPKPSDVTIQIVTPAESKRPGASVPTIDAVTGKITVGKDVPKGDYTIRVKVCDKDTPATCVEKDYKIRVRPNQSLQAIDDEYTLGFTMRTSVTTGGSVLDNDKLADKTKLSTDDVTVDRTLRKAPLVVDNDLVIMNEDGYITVKPGLPEGTYTYYYTIRTKDNSQTAEAKVVIHISKYVAADDTITVERPSKEGEETPSETSVLDNDRFNGEKPEPGAVDITLISVSESADGKIELDTTTGKIKVKPGAPVGEHTLKYKVCPKGSTTGCQEGEAKVTVQPNLTLKELTLDKPINSAVSETHTDSVLNGSTLDGQPINPSDVTMEIVNNGGIDGVTINADGQITIPKGAPSGTYTIEYKVKSNAYGVEKIGKVTVTITNDADLEFYNAISTDEGSQNNGFIIKNIDLYPNNNLKIFNRYGVLVYEKDGYTNTDPFKGISTGRATVNKDSKLPQGTYYYVLEYTDGQNQKQQKAGWLYIK